MALITVSGNVGKAELKYLENGTPVLNVSVAEKQYNYKEKQEETVWYQFSMFGERAEKQSNGLTKAKIVMVHGKEDFRIYQDKLIRQIIPIEINILAFKSNDDNSNQVPQANGDEVNPFEKEGLPYPPLDDDDLPF